jgi:hypothetical protein
VLGYIGETARMPFQRLMEHVYEKPWADTIVGWEVDPTSYGSKAEVLAAEDAAIKRERPLYNIKGNMENPLRIPPWEQKAQRQARDPGWRPPAETPTVPRQRSARPAPPVARRGPSRAPAWLLRWWGRNQLRVIGWTATWAGLFAAAWWAGADTWKGWHEPRNAAITATVILAIAAASKNRPKRRRRRSTRKRRR